MTVSNADQRAAQRYAENISKEPLGYQHAAAAVLPNLLNGSEWAFIKETEENKAEVRGQVVEILKEPRAKIYQVKGGYLVVLDYQSAVNHANAAAPGLFDAKIWAEATEKRKGAVARLERFLDKRHKPGTLSLIGIFNLNESDTITENGQTTAAFNVNVVALIQLAAARNLTIVAENGAAVPAKSFKEQDIKTLLKISRVAKSGNALIVGIR